MKPFDSLLAIVLLASAVICKTCSSLLLVIRDCLWYVLGLNSSVYSARSILCPKIYSGRFYKYGSMTAKSIVIYDVTISKYNLP